MRVLACAIVLCFKVLFVPGNGFMADSSAPCEYVRASYSIASPENIDKVSHLGLAMLTCRSVCHCLPGYGEGPGV